MIEMLNWFELSQIIHVYIKYGKYLLIIIYAKKVIEVRKYLYFSNSILNFAYCFFIFLFLLHLF